MAESDRVNQVHQSLLAKKNQVLARIDQAKADVANAQVYVGYARVTSPIITASILLGIGAVLLLPREEEPQIIVPMIDIFVQMPGASAKEVEERVTKPMEKLLWEIPGVEYIYSTSAPGYAMAVVRFYVGQDEENSIVRLNQKMFANFDLIPPGASPPLIKPRSIDDVPILALTLSSDHYDHFILRRIAAQVHDRIKEVNDVSEVKIIGGQRRQVRVTLDEARMAGYNVAPASIVPMLEQANRQLQSGSFSSGNREFLVETGGFLHTPEEVGSVVVGVFNNRPVYLRDVAGIEDGPEEPADYVLFGAGPAASHKGIETSSDQSVLPAVTLSVAKRKGTNAIEIADKVIEKVNQSKGRLIPSDVHLTITRNYGETIDMPEGSTLEETAAVTREIGDYIRTVPEVTDYQMYVGTASPYNFNGLVRHYFLRRGPNVADIQVNLVAKSERDEQSHDIAKRVCPKIGEIAARYNARVKGAEVPPGPPVLQTLVAEVYGPDYQRQIEVGRQIRDIFDKTEGVVDVDWYVEDDQPKYRFVVDKEKAALNGVSAEQVAATLRIAVEGMTVGLLHQPQEKEDVPIMLRLPPEERSSVEDLKQIKVIGQRGNLVPVGELVRVEPQIADKSIYHKNLMPVVYVTGDVAGREESPVYAILKLNEAVDQLKLPEGYQLERYVAQQPFIADKLAMKWDGEWHITYEVFRDLGLAFAAVLILIYILVVGWFQSFKTPITIMAAIPFSLVGILPAHGLMGAFFTATSMIGFIAGAGIVVRNSIILVDFIELRLKQGMPLADAVIDAGAVRFRPMLLTAAAVIVGSAVILFDPIFQGLAISLMAGEVASLLLSRMTVPVLYYLSERKRHALPELEQVPPRKVEIGI
ncbi:MAG: efflux RND transporter permease subunit [Acidobacteria bacterium]|nr:efflux RND transporter permease subunit [Acidobacteriota bacterium]